MSGFTSSTCTRDVNETLRSDTLRSETLRSETLRSETLRPLRWILLIPVILVGSMLYWSVAVGLGGMSLIAASALSTGVTLMPGPSEAAEPSEAAAPTIEITDGTASPIMVHLEESAEPEDVNDNTGAAPVMPAADENATSRVGAGSTSY